MVGAMKLATSGGGVGLGAGSTLVIRQQFDQSGETSIFRPSVLWGVGTGAIGLGAPMLLGGNQRGAMWELVEDYSEAALTAGIFSAFAPKGAGVQLPTL